MVVASYLCAVANEFICNHRERKGMNTYVYSSGEYIMGPEAFDLHSALRTA